MAKVNHKRVKQLLNEKRSKITDRQFFTSRILAGHFEDVAAAQTKRYRYNRRVHVNIYWAPKDRNGACTNNTAIKINAGHPCVTKIRGRMNRYEMISGLFAHELGHVLYTDFLAKQTYMNFLSAYKWYPAPPILKDSTDAKNEKDFWEYVKADPRNMQFAMHIAFFIANVLEDGYIESRMLSQFPGVLGYNLTVMREHQYKDMSTVTQLIEEEDDGSGHIFQSILQIMLSYALFGEIKYGETPLSDVRIQTVFKLLPQIDEAVTTTSAKDRWQIVSLILIRLWPHIEDYIELCKHHQDEAASSGESSEAGDILSGMLQVISGSSAEGEGSGTPVPGSEKIKSSGSNAAGRAKTRAMAGNSEEDNASGSDENESGEETAGAEQESDSDTDNQDPGNQSGDDSGADNITSSEDYMGSGSGKQETTDKEGGRIPFHQTDSVSEPVGGETTYDSDYQREHNDRAAADIERMLEQMAEKAACKQLENERIQELNDAAQSISYGDIHSGVKITVHRIPEVDEELEEQYHDISAPLLNISKQLQRSLVQKLKDQQRGGKQTGLVMGRRLDAHALCRNDGKVFYKNNLPNEIPRISVGLLLDESGSMSCGDRSTYARAAAIILYDFCQALNIPIMVYGHSTSWSSGVDLYSYAEFDSFDRNDKYRLMDIAARGSNRDGAALRFVAEQLSKRNEEVRILMLVSDGQPADVGYGGTAAEEDLRGIKQEYKRKGILFIAAAIGEDKVNIERIYGDSFLDITDLNQLPVKLTAVIKRFMR
ncbi:MAG: VWA domain-containing protein [Bacteroidales bacterium]|nr:VWA domain-containing protein [Bacteroidales bacterium]